ncbi:hypothetical protein GA0070622_1810 [Micromonospora sediminicola]|uniref:Uncharacterized protein n=1 Tax=Micromonospora sediminicola TaxID=946078 RepID=A0A1A9B6V3_9ACTN|nr:MULTISPECIES: hypothetical protein [Micromonospora]PGH42372.1 hypothetical protein COO58_21975 [Micromonospora sp. WMMA1996]SBT64828.1 hypothetical protein GA0070622_1810 [Micromonospora sediminicola]
MRGLLSHRVLSSVLGLVGLVAAFVLTTAVPARAGESVFIEVTPNSVQAGSRVTIRAGCDNSNNRQAQVTSDAFGGRVMLRPDNGFLTGSTTVPGNKAPGDYPVNLDCSNGNTASTMLTVLNMSQPSKGPATGGGGTAGGGRGAGSLLLVGGLVAVAVVAGVGARRKSGSRV